MEEGWRVCLVHGGAARDGGGVVDAAEAVRRVLHALAPCAKRGLRAQAHGGRSTRPRLAKRLLSGTVRDRDFFYPRAIDAWL